MQFWIYSFIGIHDSVLHSIQNVYYIECEYRLSCGRIQIFEMLKMEEFGIGFKPSCEKLLDSLKLKMSIPWQIPFLTVRSSIQGELVIFETKLYSFLSGQYEVSVNQR